MPLSKKRVREIVGFTISGVGDNPENWFNRAREFNSAAKLLVDPSHGGLSLAYYYNAGLSIELALKAIILAKSESFEKIHRLNDLAKKAGVDFTNDQNCTLELLSEIIIWSGRYPIPKSEGQWNNYYDVILEKHIVREKIGNTYRTYAHKNRFPSLENYLSIWLACENELRNVSKA